MSHSRELPEARKLELRERLASEAQLELDQLTDEKLREMASMTRQECKRKQRHDTRTPEQRLLDAVVAAAASSPSNRGLNGEAHPGEEADHGEAALHDFVEGWRSLFVEALKPSHLPPGWRTDHRRVAAVV